MTLRHFLKFRHNGKKIKLTPGETSQISRVILETGEKFVGIATDSCWLFKAVEGDINAYNVAAIKGYSYLVAIQQGDGPIVPLTKDSLEPIIKESPEAMKYLKKKNFTAAVKAFNKRREKK